MAMQLPALTGPIRRLAAAATVVLAAAALAGCAAGQDAQTVSQRPPIDGASADAGELSVRTAAVIAGDTGLSYAKGGTAMLQLVLVNNGANAEQLTSVSTPAASNAYVSSVGIPQLASSSAAGASDSGSASSSPSASDSPSTSPSASSSAPAGSSPAAQPSSTPIDVPAGQSVQIGFSPVGANILLAGLTNPIYPAQTVPVTLSFASGRTVSIDLPVQLNSNPPSAPVISAATQPEEDNS